MKVIGQYNTDGTYNNDFAEPIEVVIFGNTLRDKTDGMVWAVKDQYGDWVSPNLIKLGVKSKIKVED